MDASSLVILIIATLLLLSIIATHFSSHIGIPLLLVFLVLGMLAGEQGLGRISFNNTHQAQLIGMVALAIILFDAGLHTSKKTFYAGLFPALSLSTIGITITALITGAIASWTLHLSWLEGLLIGVIIAPTDATAVFSLLRASGIRLKQRLVATLEVESGTNDPLAVCFTLMLIHLLMREHSSSILFFLKQFILEIGIGMSIGVSGGYLLAWLSRVLKLVTGLYSLLLLAGGLLLFSATSLLEGSGFLATYLAGISLGNSSILEKQAILRFHDALAWLSQIVMFLMLGLFITPSALLQHAPQASLVTAVLIFIARPLAVWISLLPFRFTRREKLFISWIGLRGAVPIVLALFPFTAGLPQANIYLNVIFFIVLVSISLQGWSLTSLARKLNLALPPLLEPSECLTLTVAGPLNNTLLVYNLPNSKKYKNFTVNDLQLCLPPSSKILAILRNTSWDNLDEQSYILPGDILYILTSYEYLDTTNQLINSLRIKI